MTINLGWTFKHRVPTNDGLWWARQENVSSHGFDRFEFGPIFSFSLEIEIGIETKKRSAHKKSGMTLTNSLATESVCACMCVCVNVWEWESERERERERSGERERESWVDDGWTTEQSTLRDHCTHIKFNSLLYTSFTCYWHFIIQTLNSGLCCQRFTPISTAVCLVHMVVTAWQELAGVKVSSAPVMRSYLVRPNYF